MFYLNNGKSNHKLLNITECLKSAAVEKFSKVRKLKNSRDFVGDTIGPLRSVDLRNT